MRDRSVNAFALPGGYVGVHLGMIAITATADELASVLAHELSHVTQRHIARGIAPQRRASMEAMVAMLLGIFVGARTNNVDVANAAIVGSQGRGDPEQLNFSRDIERRPTASASACWWLPAMRLPAWPRCSRSCELSMRLNDDSSFPYLRDHPVTTERIAEARNRTLLSDRAPDRSDPGACADGRALPRADGRRLAGVAAPERRQHRAAARRPAAPPGTEGIALLYSEALAASKLDDHAAGRPKATQALQLALALPHREPRAERTLGLLLAEVRLAGGKPAAALQALDALPPLARATASGRLCCCARRRRWTRGGTTPAPARQRCARAPKPCRPGSPNGRRTRWPGTCSPAPATRWG